MHVSRLIKAGTRDAEGGDRNVTNNGQTVELRLDVRAENPR